MGVKILSPDTALKHKENFKRFSLGYGEIFHFSGLTCRDITLMITQYLLFFNQEF